MIETTTNKVVYVVASNPVFAFPIRFSAPSDIHCYLYTDDTETELVRGTDFTVQSKSDYSSGANVTLLCPLVPGSKLAIVRQMPMTQDVNLPEYGKLPSAALEALLDKILMISQQLKEVLDRALVYPPGATVVRPAEFKNQIVSSAAGYTNTASAYMSSAGGYAQNASACMVSAGGYAQNASSAASVAASSAASSAASLFTTSVGGLVSSAGGYAQNASGYMVSADGYASSAIDAAARAEAAVGSQVVVVDSETVGSAYIPALVGGKSYHYLRPISALTVGSASELGLHDDVIFPVPHTGATLDLANCGFAGSGTVSVTAGRWNRLNVYAGIASVTPIYHPNDLVSGSAGVWLVSANEAQTPISSGVFFGSEQVSSGRALNVYDGGIAVDPVLTDGGSCTVYSGGVVDGFSAYASGGSASTDCFLYVSSGGSLRGGVVSGRSAGNNPAVGGNVSVCSGGVVSGGTYKYAGKLHVLTGGSVVDPVIAGGNAAVSSGGTANGAVISSGAATACSGGTVLSPVLLGGTINASSGGVVSGAGVYSGNLAVKSGGTALDPVFFGGMLWGQGIVSGAIASGGSIAVSSGATVISTAINSGGTMGISGGTVSSVTVASGGKLGVSGGTATDIAMESGARLTLHVTPSVYAQGTSGGLAFAVQDGSLYGYSIDSDGVLHVHNSGKASIDDVADGGSAIVYNGGSAFFGRVRGTVAVSSGGTAKLFLITSMGSATVYNGGLVNGGEPQNTGALTVSSGGTVTSAVVSSGGTLTVSSGGTATGVVSSGGVVDSKAGAVIEYA